MTRLWRRGRHPLTRGADRCGRWRPAHLRIERAGPRPETSPLSRANALRVNAVRCQMFLHGKGGRSEACREPATASDAGSRQRRNLARRQWTSSGDSSHLRFPLPDPARSRGGDEVFRGLLRQRKKASVAVGFGAHARLLQHRRSARHVADDFQVAKRVAHEVDRLGHVASFAPPSPEGRSPPHRTEPRTAFDLVIRGQKLACSRVHASDLRRDDLELRAGLFHRRLSSATSAPSLPSLTSSRPCGPRDVGFALARMLSAGEGAMSLACDRRVAAGTISASNAQAGGDALAASVSSMLIEPRQHRLAHAGNDAFAEFEHQRRRRCGSARARSGSRRTCAPGCSGRRSSPAARASCSPASGAAKAA